MAESRARRAIDDDGDDGLSLIRDDPSDPPAVEQQRRRKKGRPGCILAIILAVILLVPIGFIAFYGGTAINAVMELKRDSSLTPIDYEGRPTASKTKDGVANAPINFVLMGSDARANDSTGRSDSLMIAHLTGDRKRLYLVSFPRDMWVPIPGHGKGKINWAYSFGGPQLTVRTLEQLLDVRMDHTVAIDFEGFIRLTDALGGVTVYNPWSSGQDYPQGEVTLQGEKALVYVRQRYMLPNGDLDRAYRQRTVVKAIIGKTLTPQVLTNPGTFSEVVNMFADSLTVDDTLDTGTIAGIASQLRMQRSEGVNLLQAPIAGFGRVGSQSVDVVDYDALGQLAKALRDDEMESYFADHANQRYEKYPEVEVQEDR